MRILFMQNIHAIGGSENYLLALLPALMARGIACEFVNVYKKVDVKEAQAYSKRMRDLGIPVHEIPTGSFASPTLLFNINKIYKKGKFDAIHTHLIYADFWASTIRRFLNRSMVVFSTKHGYTEQNYIDYIHRPEELPRGAYYHLFKFAERYITKSFACSESLNDFLIRAKLVKKGQLDVIQHGFDYPDKPDPDPSYRKGTPQLVIVGRLAPVKGHALVIGILPDLVNVHPSLKLVLVGKGAGEADIRQQVAELGMEDHVVFMGFQKNVQDYTGNSDIVLVPSRVESLPLVVLEGFSSRRPVIAFDTAGCRDVITDGEDGYLVPAYDTEVLKERILAALADPETSHRIGQRAYQKLKSYYSLDRMVSDTIAFYETVQA